MTRGSQVMTRIRILGLAIALLLVAALPASAQFQDQSTYAGTGGGSANAQTVALANAASYADIVGVVVKYVPAATNTGATTVNVNSLGATNFYKSTLTGLVPMTGNELVAGQITLFTYDGTEAVLIGTPIVNLPINPSFVVNGDFLYDQPHEGTVYDVCNEQLAVMDGFDSHAIPTSGSCSANQITVQRDANALFPNPYGTYNATITIVSTPGASDHLTFEQKMEGDRIAPFGYGLSTAQPVTVSWREFCSTGGTYSLAVVRSNDQGRSYVAPYTIPTTTWTSFSITIPGDTASGWLKSGSTQAIEFDWVLGAASHFQTSTLNAWQNGEYLAGSGQYDMGAHTGAYCTFSLVKIEIGPSATPFVPPLPGVELTIAQHYYSKSYPIGVAPGTVTPAGADVRIAQIVSGVGVGGTVKYPVGMLCNPTPTIYSPGAGSSGSAYDYQNSVNVPVTIGSHDPSSFLWYAVPSTGTAGYIGAQWTSDCRLD